MILLKGTTRKITSQEGGFLNILRPLIAAGLPLMKKILTPTAKNVLLPIELSAGMLPASAAIQNKFHGSGRCPTDLASQPSESASRTTTLIISNEEREDMMKIVKSLEEPGLLVQGIKETIKNETKEQKGVFLPMLLRTIAASLLESALKGKGVRAGEIVIRLGENFFAVPYFKQFWNTKILSKLT